jgi:hypothetical protein
MKISIYNKLSQDKLVRSLAPSSKSKTNTKKWNNRDFLQIKKNKCYSNIYKSSKFKSLKTDFKKHSINKSILKLNNTDSVSNINNESKKDFISKKSKTKIKKKRYEEMNAKGSLNVSRHVHWQDKFMTLYGNNSQENDKQNPEGLIVSNIISNKVYDDSTVENIKGQLGNQFKRNKQSLFDHNRNKSAKLEKDLNKGKIFSKKLQIQKFTPRKFMIKKNSLNLNLEKINNDKKNKKHKRRSDNGGLIKYPKTNKSKFKYLSHRKKLSLNINHKTIFNMTSRKLQMNPKKNFSFMTMNVNKTKMQKINTNKSLSKTPKNLKSTFYKTKIMGSKSRNLSPINYFKLNSRVKSVNQSKTANKKGLFKNFTIKFKKLKNEKKGNSLHRTSIKKEKNTTPFHDSNERYPRSSNLIPKKMEKSPKKQIQGNKTSENFSYQKGMFKAHLMKTYKKNSKSSKKLENLKKKNNSLHSKKLLIDNGIKKLKPLSNVYLPNNTMEKEMCQPHTARVELKKNYFTKNQINKSEDEGKVLFIINFNLGIENIIIKYRESSNAIQLSQKIAFKYDLSDEKREEIYMLILKHLNSYNLNIKKTPKPKPSIKSQISKLKK